MHCIEFIYIATNTNKDMTTPKFTIKKEFDDKLRKLRIRQKFVRNIITCDRHNMSMKGYTPEEVISHLNDYVNWKHFIIHAFDWENSPEGHKFWNSIMNK
jgi:hypothetical protein